MWNTCGLYLKPLKTQLFQIHKGFLGTKKHIARISSVEAKRSQEEYTKIHNFNSIMV